jgi:hypothetical protein
VCGKKKAEYISNPYLTIIVGVCGVSLYKRGDLIESRFMVTPEGMPETARLLRPKQSNIENAVAVAILEGADSPATGAYLEPEDELRPRLDPNLLHRSFEEIVGLPKRDVDGAFSR